MASEGKKEKDKYKNVSGGTGEDVTKDPPLKDNPEYVKISVLQDRVAQAITKAQTSLEKTMMDKFDSLLAQKQAAFPQPSQVDRQRDLPVLPPWQIYF